MITRMTLGLLASTALLAASPSFAQTRDGTPGNPPSTATGRAVDQMQGQASRPDGTPGNPPGTAAGRAADSALGTNMSGANPPTGQDAMQTTTRPDGTTVTTTTAPAAGAQAGAAGATTPAEAARGGVRISKLIGTDVYNEANDSIGEVQDIVLPRVSGSPIAIVSVGGFLGIGAKQVAVPLTQLQHNADRDRWVLPGATKESLQALPSFAFETDSGAATTRAGSAGETRPGATGGAPSERPAGTTSPARQ